jgi:hypothetical protein
MRKRLRLFSFHVLRTRHSLGLFAGRAQDSSAKWAGAVSEGLKPARSRMVSGTEPVI